MNEDPTQPPPPTPRGRWRRPVLLAVVIVLAVWVLFTWVFPWITPLLLSPTVE